jgi:hypothetical protein
MVASLDENRIKTLQIVRPGSREEDMGLSEMIVPGNDTKSSKSGKSPCEIVSGDSGSLQ